jgi:hypothetical protein
MRQPLVLICLVLGGFAAPAVAATWSAEQQEIWRLEEEQWRLSAAEDPSWIESMVHPNASLWGNGWPGPRNRASLTRWSKYESASTTVLEQELFPLAITITGNVAVAQYRYRVARENFEKKQEVVTGRWTDVFVKEGGRWLFITWDGGDDPKSD